MADDAHAEIRHWLEQSGYKDEEVAKVMQRVSEYDYQTIHDSWFDSLGSGEVSMHKIIREALGREHGK